MLVSINHQHPILDLYSILLKTVCQLLSVIRLFKVKYVIQGQNKIKKPKKSPNKTNQQKPQNQNKKPQPNKKLNQTKTLKIPKLCYLSPVLLIIFSWLKNMWNPKLVIQVAISFILSSTRRKYLILKILEKKFRQ